MEAFHFQVPNYVLVTYCYIAYHPKLSVLSQQTFVILYFLRVRHLGVGKGDVSGSGNLRRLQSVIFWSCNHLFSLKPKNPLPNSPLCLAQVGFQAHPCSCPQAFVPCRVDLCIDCLGVVMIISEVIFYHICYI